MKNESNELDGKQAYEKPRLRVIELVAEEVMGIGCKIASESAPSISACNLGGCQLPGS